MCRIRKRNPPPKKTHHQTNNHQHAPPHPQVTQGKQVTRPILELFWRQFLGQSISNFWGSCVGCWTAVQSKHCSPSYDHSVSQTVLLLLASGNLPPELFLSFTLGGPSADVLERAAVEIGGYSRIICGFKIRWISWD